MKHFIELSDWSSGELRDLLDMASHLKREWRTGGNRPVLRGKILGMVFQKPSLRTRVSFEVGMQHLGGHAIMLGPSEIGLGKRESIADVARVLSGYVQGIMARVFDHQHIVELAEWATVPVINGLSDDRHPCQAMADVLTIQEHFGHTDGLKVTFIGDGNNVATSLAVACARFGMDFTLAAPPGYQFTDATMQHLEAQLDGTEFQVINDPVEAVQGADVLYTDTWVSMGQEEDTQRRLQDLEAYQINDGLLAQAGPKAIVLHCLPAHRGQEITDSVADGPQSAIFAQAENRLHAQKAILVHLMSM